MASTEIPLMHPLMQPSTAQFAPTGDAHVNVQARAMRESEMDHQNGDDAGYAFTTGMDAVLPRGATPESSAPDAPVDQSTATLDMQMIGGRDIALASFFPSPSPLDLIVVAAGAEDALHHVVSQYRSHTTPRRHG